MSSDPDFAGFVRMICEEKCNIEFHIACWKANKESVVGVGKINDKVSNHFLRTLEIIQDIVVEKCTAISANYRQNLMNNFRKKPTNYF